MCVTFDRGVDNCGNREPLNIFIKYKTMVIPNIEIIFISQRFDSLLPKSVECLSPK